MRLLAVLSRLVGHAAPPAVPSVRQSSRAARLMCWLRHRPHPPSLMAASSVADCLAPWCWPGRQAADAIDARRSRHTDAEAVTGGLRARRQRREAARAVIGAVIGTGGWSSDDLSHGRPTARDEQAVTSRPSREYRGRRGRCARAQTASRDGQCRDCSRDWQRWLERY